MIAQNCSSKKRIKKKPASGPSAAKSQRKPKPKVKRKKPRPPSIGINEQLRRLLLSGSHQGKAWDRRAEESPTISRYAKWCRCSHTTLLNFANGKTQRLHPDIMDRLAFLAGLYPAADASERLQRLKDAEEWLEQRDYYDAYWDDSLMDYLQERYEYRIEIARIRAEEMADAPLATGDVPDVPIASHAAAESEGTTQNRTQNQPTTAKKKIKKKKAPRVKKVKKKKKIIKVKKSPSKADPTSPRQTPHQATQRAASRDQPNGFPRAAKSSVGRSTGDENRTLRTSSNRS